MAARDSIGVIGPVCVKDSRCSRNKKAQAVAWAVLELDQIIETGWWRLQRRCPA